MLQPNGHTSLISLRIGFYILGTRHEDIAQQGNTQD